MARAAAIADEALGSVLPLLAAAGSSGPAGGRPQELTESHFAAALDHAMRQLGAEDSAFETIVASGENSAKPHARPGGRVIGPGDPVVVDFGAVFDGYRSDMTRTFWVGGPPVGEMARANGTHVLQLMVLLDSEQMLGAGSGQFDSIKTFFHDMPANVEIGVGWLLQGKVVVTQPFTTDHNLAGKALVAKTREEAADPENDNGNPFSCLGYLARHWPSPSPGKLRAVLMFTDGIIRNNAQPQSGDQVGPECPGRRGRVGDCQYHPISILLAGPHCPGAQTAAREATRGPGELRGNGRADRWCRPLSRSLRSGLPRSVAQQALYNPEERSGLTVADPFKPGTKKDLDMKSNRDDIKLFGPDQVVAGNVIK